MGRRASECARAADMVTTTTPALLAEYAPHGRGHVIENAIPRRIAELPPAYEREPDVVTVGWTGSVVTHPYDLQVMGSGLQQALDATRGRSRFMVIGQKMNARQLLGLSEDPEESGWMPDIDEYVTAVGERFDIGIAPLRIDRFNTCKSWLKALEYSARGIPFVNSPSDEYERLGLGWRAKSPKDWTKALTSTINHRDRRTEQAIRAREAIVAGHLTEHRAQRWVAAWRQALDHRAAARRKYA
jgi:hypothetical protein